MSSSSLYTTNAFSSKSLALFQSAHHHNRHRSVVVQSSKKQNVRWSTFSSLSLTALSSNTEALRKQEVAKAALLKLLEKQKRELKDTENLLQQLSLETNNNETYSSLFNSTSTATTPTTTTFTSMTNASSITASVFAGVDYGFQSRSEGCRFESLQSEYSAVSDDSTSTIMSPKFKGYGPPANIWKLGVQQFNRNLNAIRGEYREEENINLTPKQKKLQSKLKNLTLNSKAIWEREKKRGEIEAPLIIKIPYYVLCYLLDTVFEHKNPFSRFFLLETVARMPYFSYITMLHLYETLGFWRRSADVKRIHFAEEWNEYHHLLIMESLGGDQAWWVRFMAQHSAIVYFLVLSHLFAISPSLSYKFSEMLEGHAVDTYGQFLDENEELLKSLPPSLAATEYYVVGVTDPMFGEYQTSALAYNGEVRKPGTNMRTLYDVFHAIRSDEGDHVGTMKACLDPKVAVLSPSLERRFVTGAALAAAIGYFLATNVDVTMSDLSSLGDSSDAIISDFMEEVADESTSSMFEVTEDVGILGTLLKFFRIF